MQEHQTEVLQKEAFLLTSHWESGDDSCLVFWWQTAEGPVKQVISQSAVCFVRKVDIERLKQHVESLSWPIHFRDVELRNFQFEPVAACYLPNEFLFRWRSLLDEESIPCWEADIRTTDRFLMERFVYGSACLAGEFEWDAIGKYDLLRGGRVKPSSYRPNLNWLSLDIETSIPRQGEDYRLYSVGLVTSGSRIVLLNTEHRAESISEHALDQPIEYFSSEFGLLDALNQYMARLDADVILGWNLVQFDLQVLANLYRKHAVSMSWGRDGTLVRLRPVQPGQDRLQAHIPGRVALDGIEILRAAGHDFESFSLQSVATHFLGEGKLLTGSDRGDDIQNLYRENLARFAAYNLQDCDLVWRIFEQADLLSFAI
ncbi:MAG: 3'-5' exonuclease, partial [Oceanobacter sp.]